MANGTSVGMLSTQEQKQNTYIPADRSRQDLARKRYREDDVEAPEGVNTSEGGG